MSVVHPNVHNYSDTGGEETVKNIFEDTTMCENNTEPTTTTKSEPKEPLIYPKPKKHKSVGEFILSHLQSYFYKEGQHEEDIYLRFTRCRGHGAAS